MPCLCTSSGALYHGWQCIHQMWSMSMKQYHVCIRWAQAMLVSIIFYFAARRGWWRWALVSPDGVAPSRIVCVSASVNLPLHHKVQKFSSGTGSPGGAGCTRKRAVKWLFWLLNGTEGLFKVRGSHVLGLKAVICWNWCNTEMLLVLQITSKIWYMTYQIVAISLTLNDHQGQCT